MALSRACRLALTLWCALVAFAAAQEAPPSGAGETAAQKPPPAGLSGLAAYEGKTVSDIQFRGYQAEARVMDSLRTQIEQPVQAPLDRRKVSGSLKTLFETGRFADLEAEVEPVAPD